MFFRWTSDLSYYLRREEIKYQLNENNVYFKTKWKINKFVLKIGNENFESFKFWIFQRWILKNFSYTLKFINRFKKLVKKFGLILNAKEEEFLYFTQEVNFTLWRPMKIVPVNFPLEKKEKCFFKNHHVNIHTFIGKDNKITFLHKGTLLLTNQRLIIENEITKNNLSFNLNQITMIENLEYGIKIVINDKSYLLREQNNVLILALLYRILGKDKLKFDLYAIPNLIKPIKYNQRYNL